LVVVLFLLFAVRLGVAGLASFSAITFLNLGLLCETAMKND